MLGINLAVLIFGGGVTYNQNSQTLKLAQVNQANIYANTLRINAHDVLLQRHEDNIEQLFEKIYGTPPSQAHKSSFKQFAFYNAPPLPWI